MQLIQSVWAESRASTLHSSIVCVQARLSVHTDWIRGTYMYLPQFPRRSLLFYMVPSSLNIVNILYVDIASKKIRKADLTCIAFLCSSNGVLYMFIDCKLIDCTTSVYIRAHVRSESGFNQDKAHT